MKLRAISEHSFMACIRGEGHEEGRSDPPALVFSSAVAGWCVLNLIV